MNILFITHYFQPETNCFYGLPLAKELINRGHSVQVITGFPNYPGGRIYDGYRGKLFMRENMDGVDVIRLPLYPSHDQSSFKRIFCYCTMSLSMTIFAPFIVKKADVSYVVQGPATLGIPAIILKWFRRIPFVYNIQDIWPDSLLSTGMFKEGIAYKILHRWCNFVYKQAYKITVIAPGMKDVLTKRGVSEKKIEVVYNWADDLLVNSPEPDEELKSKLLMTGKFNIVFAGNIGSAQGLDSVLQAADIVKQTCPGVQFVFIGEGVAVEGLKEKVKEKKLSNVIFHPRKPINEIGTILKLADVLLIHLKKDELFEITVPSKTQAYLAIGRPILIGVNGDSARLVQQSRAGLICEPENPDSIAKSVETLLGMTKDEMGKMGINGKDFYDKQMSFQIGTEKLEKIFLNITRRF